MTTPHDPINEDPSSKLHRRLADDTAAWLEFGHEASFLATGARLDQYQTWAEETVPSLTSEEAEYLQASVEQQELRQALDILRKEQEEAQERHTRRRLGMLLVIVLVAVLVVTGIGTVLISQQQMTVNYAATAAAQALGTLNAQTAIAYAANATAIQQQLRDQAARSESQRLAAEANQVLQDAGNNAELATLLSIRALNTAYSPEADTILGQADGLVYTQRLVANKAGAVTGPIILGDGTQVFADTLKLTVRLWDVQSGRILRTFSDDGVIAIECLALSPDGKYLVTGNADQSARLWDVQSGALLYKLTGQQRDNLRGVVRTVAFSHDSRHVVTGNLGKTVWLWDVQTGAQLRQLDNIDVRDSLAFSPDDKMILAASDNGAVQLWDIQASPATLIRTFQGDNPGTQKAIFSPDGHEILTTDGIVWDVQTGTQLRHLQINGAIAFSPDGKYVLASYPDNTARLLDAQTGAEIRRLTGATTPIQVVAFGYDGRQVLTADTIAVRIWEARPGVGAREFTIAGSDIQGLIVTPNGKQLLTFGNTVTLLWDAQTGDMIHQFFVNENFGDVTSTALSPDGNYVLTGHLDGTARLWFARTGQQITLFDPGPTQRIKYVAFSDNSQQVLTYNIVDGGYSLGLWNAQSGRLIRTVKTDIYALHMARSPDGKTILLNTGSGVALLDWQSGTIRSRFEGDQKARNVFSEGMALSPDGKTLLVGYSDDVALLWDVATSSVLRSLTGHGSAILTVAFSPDGKYALTGSQDKTARLWDIESGAEVRRYVGNTEFVTAVAFSPDGRTVYTGTHDGTIRQWDVDYHDTLSFACTQVFRDLSNAERLQFGIADLQPTCPH